MLNTRSTTPTPLFRLLPLVVTCLAASACSDSSMTVLDVNGADSGVRQSRTQLDASGGQSQVGQVNLILPTPLGVKVTNQAGDPLVGVTVYWTFAMGGGAATAAGAATGSLTTTTDNSGVARAYWHLGTKAGDQQATAGLSSNTNKGNGKGNGSLTFYAQATPGDPASVVVSPRSATLSAGKDTTLTAAVSDKWSNPIANAQVTWSAGPSTVAIVNGKGRVSTLSPGSATVKASAGSVTGTASISVTGTPSTAVAQITVTPSSLSFSALGAPAQLTTAVSDSAGSLVTADLQWSSLDPGVATVDASGVVKAIANGSTSVIVSATCCAVADTVPVSVAQVPQTVTISSSLLSLHVGDADTLVALVKDANGFLVTGATLAWSSSDPGVAAVDSAGVLRAVAVGSATITASTSSAAAAPAPSGSSTVSSVQGEVSVLVSASTSTADPATVTDLHVAAVTDSSVTLRWTQVDDGTGSPAEYALRYGTPTLSWGSAYSTEAAVSGTVVGDSLEYTFKGLQPGTGYQFGLVSYRGTLNVDAVFGGLSNLASSLTTDSGTIQSLSVTVTPASLSFSSLGATAQLTAVAKDSSGNIVSNPGFSWKSLASAIVTVNGSGLVTAQAIGATAIIVSAACCGSDTVAVVVTDAAVPTNADTTREPSGMKVLCDFRGTVREADGHAFGCSDFGSWYTDPLAPPDQVAIVTDTTNPLGTGKAIRFRFTPQFGMKSGEATAKTFSGGPYKQLYIRLRFFVEKSEPWSGGKLFYVGAADASRHNVGSPTQFYLGGYPDGSTQASARAQLTNQNDSPDPVVIKTNQLPPIGTEATSVWPVGEWITQELLIMAESSSGAADGKAYLYVNGHLMGYNENVAWDLAADTDLGFDGLQWYATKNTVATEEYYRVGELYIAGK